jgi:hypothetical protein
MSASNKSMYVYDNASGTILYTIDTPSAKQIDYMSNKSDTYFWVGDIGKPILNHYVTQNTSTQLPEGIAPRQYINVNVSNTVLIANGTDEVNISDIPYGTHVSVVGEDLNFFANSTYDFIDLSADGYSLQNDENVINVKMTKYGFYDNTIKINLVYGE